MIRQRDGLWTGGKTGDLVRLVTPTALETLTYPGRWSCDSSRWARTTLACASQLKTTWSRDKEDNCLE